MLESHFIFGGFMSFWVRIIELFDMEMTEPSLYGWFHIMFLCITVLATVLLCKFFKEGTEKQVRMIVLTASVIAIFFEVYKQINFTFSVENGIVKGDFQWYAFPFQFCNANVCRFVVRRFEAGKGA